MTVRGLDLPLLTAWLGANLPDRMNGELAASILAGGRSNLTYRLDAGAGAFVLRRPPLGHVQSTAHDMAREFRVISALAATSVPVPTALRFEDDSSGAAGVGTPFYLMDFVEGRVIATKKENEAFTKDQVRALSLDLVSTLARLHETDPQSVGLADFGRPDGYLERQLRRWDTQYDGSRNRELPELDRLQSLLREHVPQTLETSLLHGDFRLDNALVRVVDGTPRIAAILDWEMATIGDSFADLGLLGLYWNISEIKETAGVPSAVDPAAGYPTFAELVDAYAAERRISVPDLSWYVAFAAFKLAVILEGIHFRFQAGETVGTGFDSIGSIVTPLANAGLRSLRTEREN
jgi:aminoglycoside phosphotransferase (APT) family kinase protein